MFNRGLCGVYLSRLVDTSQVLKSMEEIWRPVVGYEGLYEVSNLGRLKSLARVVNNNGGDKFLKEKILKLSYTGTHDYASYRFQGKTYRIHRVVARAFIPNPENKPCVNHIDNNSKNNCVSNLEWCTHKENMLHASKIGMMKGNGNLYGEKIGVSKLKESQVKEIRNLFGTVHISILVGKYNVSISTIRNICSRKVWKHVI